jgi:hypothetical protein
MIIIVMVIMITMVISVNNNNNNNNNKNKNKNKNSKKTNAAVKDKNSQARRLGGVDRDEQLDEERGEGLRRPPFVKGSRVGVESPSTPRRYIPQSNHELCIELAHPAMVPVMAVKTSSRQPSYSSSSPSHSVVGGAGASMSTMTCCSGRIGSSLSAASSIRKLVISTPLESPLAGDEAPFILAVLIVFQHSAENRAEKTLRCRRSPQRSLASCLRSTARSLTRPSDGC